MKIFGAEVPVVFDYLVDVKHALCKLCPNHSDGCSGLDKFDEKIAELKKAEEVNRMLVVALIRHIMDEKRLLYNNGISKDEVFQAEMAVQENYPEIKASFQEFKAESEKVAKGGDSMTLAKEYDSIVKLDLKKFGKFPYSEMHARGVVKPEVGGYIKIVVPIHPLVGIKVLDNLKLERDLDDDFTGHHQSTEGGESDE